MLSKFLKYPNVDSMGRDILSQKGTNIQQFVKNVSRATDPSEWTVVDGTTMGLNGGTKISYTSSSAAGYCSASIDLPYDMSTRQVVLKIKALDSNLNRIGVQLRCNSREFGKRFEGCIWKNNIESFSMTIPIQPQGLDAYDNATILDLRDFRMIVLEVFAEDADQPTSILIESIDIVNGFEAPGVAVITFDDGYKSTNQLAYAKMTQFNYPGCVYVETDNVGIGDKMSLQQLQELYNAGWDLASHTKSGGELDDTLENVRDQLRGSQQWLADQGFLRAMRHISYPGGYYNDTVLTETKRLYLSARKVGGPSVVDGLGFSGWPLCDRYLIKNLYCTNTMDAGIEFSAIDRLSHGGGVCIFTFHDIIDGTPTKIEDWSKTRFYNFMEYINLKGINVLRISDLFDESV